MIGIFFAQGKNLVVKFDFKQVDRMVIVFEDEVDLQALLSVGTFFCKTTLTYTLLNLHFLPTFSRV